MSGSLRRWRSEVQKDTERIKITFEGHIKDTFVYPDIRAKVRGLPEQSGHLPTLLQPNMGEIFHTKQLISVRKKPF